MTATIEETVLALEAAVQAAMPNMAVIVNISMAPMERPMVSLPVKGVEVPAAADPAPAAKAKEDTDPVSLDSLRTLLNAYVKKVGKDEALELVKEFSSDGSPKPHNVPEDKYKEMISRMGGLEVGEEAKVAA